jgi:hypothetical protein
MSLLDKKFSEFPNKTQAGLEDLLAFVDLTDPTETFNITKGDLLKAVNEEIAIDTLLDNTHDVVVGDSSGADLNLTLPAVIKGKRYTVIKKDASNNIEVFSQSGETINGLTSFVISEQYRLVVFYCDGIEWFANTKGEVNTASNLGTGADVFKQKAGVNLEFRSITTDGTVTVIEGPDEVGLSVNHNNILNKGTISHDDIDDHIQDPDIHFEEGDIDHANIQNVGTNTHADIDTHIANTAIHSAGKALVSSNDTTQDYLLQKLVPGVGVDIAELNDSGNETLSFALKTFVLNKLSTGMLSNALLSKSGAQNFNLEAGSGIIVNNPTGTVTLVTWTEKLNQTLTNLAIDGVTYIAIDSGGNIVQSTGFTDAQAKTYILIGAITHFDFTNTGHVYNVGNLAFNNDKTFDDLNLVFNKSGNIYSGATLGLNKTAGVTFGYNLNRVDITTPNQTTDPETLALTFDYMYKDGSGDWTLDSGKTNIIPGKYDDGSGTLQDVDTLKWTVQKIFWLPGQNDHIVLFGNTQYSSKDEALTSIANNFDRPDLRYAVLRAYLVVQEGTTNLSNAQFVEVTSGVVSVSQKNSLSNRVIRSGQTQYFSASTGGSIDVANAKNLNINMDANLALSLTGGFDGADLIITLTQDGTGSRLLTLGTGLFMYPTELQEVDVVLSSAAGAIDLLGLKFNATQNKWMVTAFNTEYV